MGTRLIEYNIHVTSTAPEVVWNPLDPSYKADPHPIWRRLRDEAPLYRDEQYDFWALSRFSDVMAASMDPHTFSSAHGTVLEMMSERTVGGAQMIFLDQPEHTMLRRLVSRAFTPRRVAALESQVRELCAGLLNEQRDREEFDYVADFGALVPANVIAMLLGVPEADRDHVRETIDGIFHLEPGMGMLNDVSLQAMATLHSYLSEQISERRTQPRDDMLSDLVAAEVTEPDGTHRRLTPQEATDFGILLVAAGTETVARLLGWAGAVLADYPDQRSELASDPSLIPERRGGAAALRVAVAGAGSLDHSERRAARGHACPRIQGPLAHRLRRPRRAGVPRRRPLRRPPQLRPAPLAGLRDPLLPGCSARPARRQGGDRGDAGPLPRMGGGPRPQRVPLHEHGPRLQQPAHFDRDGEPRLILVDHHVA